MTVPKNRSNSVRKIKVRGAKGMRIHYRRRVKGTRHYCALCCASLAGTSSQKGLAASKRTPSRKFAGHLCHACAMQAIKLSARVSQGILDISSVDIQMRKYISKA